MNYESRIMNQGLNWLTRTVNFIIPNSLFLIRSITRYSLFIILAAFLFVALAAPALAQPAGFGLEETAGAGGLFGFEADGVTPRTTPPSFGPATVAGKIVGYLLAFVGVIFFGLMIWGGILWMTARGNTEQVTKAQDLIKSAVIGILIVFMSYVLTNFVITRLTQGLR